MSISLQRRALGALAHSGRSLVLAVGLGVAAAAPPLALPSPALARGAPDSFADLSAKVIDAVVNISTTQKVDNRVQVPDLPPDSPLREFFEEFLRRGPGGPNGPGRPGGPPQRQNSLGSGFVIDPSGIIVTNKHVIADADEIHVTFTDGTKLKAELVGTDSRVDLAVLRVKPAKPLTAVKWGDSDELRVGDWVLAIGNPFGLGGTVTAGIVSARNRDINPADYGNYIQTDAAINRGNSGGPLFNMNGDVIGINTAILSPTGGSIGLGFSIPANMAKNVVDQLVKFGETRRGWIGVRIQPVDETMAESLGLKSAHGAMIAGLTKNGPAEKAGIEPGDVIVKFDGRDIKEMRELPRLVGETPVGKKVDVVIVRKGKERTVQMELARLEENVDGQNRPVSRRDEPARPDVRQKVFGLELGAISDDARRRFRLKDGVKGVLVTAVDPNSIGADRQLRPGDVIEEVQQEPVATPADVTRRIDALRAENRRSVLLRVVSADGETRFVAIQLN